MIDFETARAVMVESQVRTSDVTDHDLIGAMLAVPRERFVPAKLQALAYIDRDLAIKEPAAGAPGRYLMQPATFARLVQLAEIRPTDKILDVGAGTGYAAAVLARLGSSVVALESDPELVSKARQALEGESKITVVDGPLQAGHSAAGPYDVILFGGSVEVMPQAFYDQLAEGGRMVSVTGTGGAAVAKVTMRMAGEMSSRVAFNAAVEPIPGFSAKREFVF